MKPWSISTTVRSPERLRDFLRILKMLEGKPFDADNQVKYQILLIQHHLYRPTDIPAKYQKYFENPVDVIPYSVAEKVFWNKNYEDPPMRGRQSVNPLNKLGFSIARENAGNIQITPLGNLFLQDEYDIAEIFFKCFLKLQFPNPWSEDFAASKGFDINPFIATLHLVNRLNQVSKSTGISKAEFSYFIPTLIHYKDIDLYVEKILEYRKTLNKENFILKFLQDFYQTKNIQNTKINNLLDYGDNAIRYFRLTKYLQVELDAFGGFTKIDLEPSRNTEIKQLLTSYDGSAMRFTNINEYINYLTDINQPVLPWQTLENLQKIAQSLKQMIENFCNQNEFTLSPKNYTTLTREITYLNYAELQNYVEELRKLHTELTAQLTQKTIKANIQYAIQLKNLLQDKKSISKIEPLQFEKIVADIFRVIDDEIKIQPNYPTDDMGNPISHSPGGKPDIECYYQNFKKIVEVSLNTSKMQWVVEGQPIMRHLRAFENKYPDDQVFCIFVSPKIHPDTFSMYWIATKYEYDGKPQKIVPLTIEQLAFILECFIEINKNNKTIYHTDLLKLYKDITAVSHINGFTEWAREIQNKIQLWKKELLTQ